MKTLSNKATFRFSLVAIVGCVIAVAFSVAALNIVSSVQEKPAVLVLASKATILLSLFVAGYMVAVAKNTKE